MVDLVWYFAGSSLLSAFALSELVDVMFTLKTLLNKSSPHESILSFFLKRSLASMKLDKKEREID